MYECEQVITLSQWEFVGSQSCIMLFDLAADSGHHSQYLNYLIKYWYEQELSKPLVLVTSPDFFKKHILADEFTNYCLRKNVWFVEVSPDEYSQWQNKKNFSRMLHEWNIYCKYASLLNAEHCLLMYFDSLQLSVVLGQKSPCLFSGIYFRPSFHYHQFEGYNHSFSDFLWHLRKRILLGRVLKNPQLKTLFCLDEFAVEYMQYSRVTSKLTYLPDPIDLSKAKNNGSDRVRSQFEIEQGRTIFLCFGDSGERKGIKQVLQAVELLSSNYCKKICLVVAGVNEIRTQDTGESIKQITSKLPIQIIVQYQFIPPAEVSEYFDLADVVLVPYQRHIGMSGVLLHAALANKPVLSSNYGLIGKVVQENCLGIAVDTESPQQIANALVQFIDEYPSTFINKSDMANFVKKHDSQYFSKILVEGIS
jgi:glycosyltransferase involved in cell wall biosynthesis